MKNEDTNGIVAFACAPSLVKAVDLAAAEHLESRSSFCRRILAAYVRERGLLPSSPEHGSLHALNDAKAND